MYLAYINLALQENYLGLTLICRIASLQLTLVCKISIQVTDVVERMCAI